MWTIEQLLLVVRAYAKATGLAEGTVSSRFLDRGSRYDALLNGGDMRTRVVRRAMEKLSGNWPEGAAWPDGVERPALGDIPPLPPDRPHRIPNPDAEAGRREGDEEDVRS